MKLNLKFYKNDIFYKTINDEEKIIKYINENDNENYNDIIKNDTSEETILTLSNLRKNIIYSYDFKKNSTILEIGAHFGEITQALCEKATKVVAVEFNKRNAEVIAKRYKNEENLEIIVGNLRDIEFEEKFDYIVLCGIIEYAQIVYNTKNAQLELLKYCKGLLKEEGKLLIATDNKFAMKSYVGDIDECTGITFDSITDYKSNKNTYKLGKEKLKNLLEEVGMKYYNFFYPLPDYKLSSYIFSDKYLPSSSKINGYFPYYKDNSSVFFSEVDAYDAIIKENKEMFPFFANSYFIEASKEAINTDIKYVSFNNCRKTKYQLMTKIRENIVEKTAINEEAKQHFTNMAKNINALKSTDIEILDNVEGEKIISKFVNSKLASQVISDNKEDKQEILKILNIYKKQIEKQAITYSENMRTVFEKYLVEVDKNILKEFHYLKDGYWDMILKNCFIIDEKCIFFDQEWKEENVPTEFLIYRSIINIEKVRSKIQEYDLYNKIGIKKYIPIFEKLDKAISNEIIDDKMLEFYQRRHNNPIYDCITLREDKTNLEKENIDLKEEIDKLKGTLNNIYQSKSWKFIRKISNIKNRLKG